MSNVVIAYKMGINQLRPMAPRMPDDRCAVGLFLGPNSESITMTMAINVDEPNNNTPPNVELITPYQCCNEIKQKETFFSRIRDKRYDKINDDVWFYFCVA